MLDAGVQLLGATQFSVTWTYLIKNTSPQQIFYMYGYDSVSTYGCDFFSRCGDRTRTSPIKTEILAKFRPKQVDFNWRVIVLNFFLPFTNNLSKGCDLPFFTSCLCTSYGDMLASLLTFAQRLRAVIFNGAHMICNNSPHHQKKDRRPKIKTTSRHTKIKKKEKVKKQHKNKKGKEKTRIIKDIFHKKKCPQANGKFLNLFKMLPKT